MAENNETEMMGARLCAWLDQELPAEEALNVETALGSDATLRKTAADFRQCDTLLREWYGALDACAGRDARTTASMTRAPLQLPIIAKRSTRRTPRWAFFTAAGIAAAAIAIVLFAFPALQGRHAMTLAQYSMDKTAEALAHVKGMSAQVSVAIIKHLDKPDEQGRSEEKRTAKGQITFADIGAPSLKFTSNEHWDAVDSEPALDRVWGQADGAQWLSETQGGSTNAFSFENSFDPDAATALATLTGDRDDGSPVDVRTRQAVEGLALLVKSFGHDRFLKWMGCNWTFAGGSGKVGDAWIYTVQPFAGNGGAAGPATVWTLRVWTTRGDGVIDGVDLEESISNPATGALQQSFRTTYGLTFSDQELNVARTNAANAAGETGKKTAPDDGGF